MKSNTAILHPELVAIDGANGKIYFGGRTDWFPSPAQRKLKGGAVVGSELLSYLAATRPSLWDLYPPRHRRTQEEFEGLMNRLWDYLSPKAAGDYLEMDGFTQGLNEYVSHLGHTLNFNVLSIGGAEEARPSADRCQGFIDDALERDTPVAFVNRTRGEKGETVCTWSLIVARKGSRAVLADDGSQQTMDFRLWYDTTALGGALAFAILTPL